MAKRTYKNWRHAASKNKRVAQTANVFLTRGVECVDHLHVVDQLGRVREMISALKEAESNIRDRILASGTNDLAGLEFSAAVSTQIINRISPELAKEKLTPKQLADITVSAPIVFVRVKPLSLFD
jgi:hypothetical protein